VRFSVALALVLGVAACSTVLDISEEDTPPVRDSGTDVAADGAVVGPDAADGGDAAANPCGRECNPAACTKCVPYVAWAQPGQTILAVAAAKDRIFFTSATPSPSVWSVKDGVLTQLHKNEAAVGGVEVTGPDEIRWGVPAGDAGVYRSTFMGASRAPALTNYVDCVSLAFVAPGTHFCSRSVNKGQILKELANGTLTSWAGSPGDVAFLATNGTTVVWTTPTVIRKGTVGEDILTIYAGQIVLDTDVKPAGIALVGNTIYFTQTTGAVERVQLDGSGRFELFNPATPPSKIADIAVDPDAKRVFWAQGSDVMGLVLPPE
jgi:hypothetical protein